MTPFSKSSYLLGSSAVDFGSLSFLFELCLSEFCNCVEFNFYVRKIQIIRLVKIKCNYKIYS